MIQTHISSGGAVGGLVITSCGTWQTHMKTNTIKAFFKLALAAIESFS
jgi:hypothetical protein